MEDSFTIEHRYVHFIMDSYAFPEVLFVVSEWVAFRKELSVLVKGGILVTLLQPNENQRAACTLGMASSHVYTSRRIEQTPVGHAWNSGTNHASQSLSSCLGRMSVSR